MWRRTDKAGCRVASHATKNLRKKVMKASILWQDKKTRLYCNSRNSNGFNTPLPPPHNTRANNETHQLHSSVVHSTHWDKEYKTSNAGSQYRCGRVVTGPGVSIHNYRTPSAHTHNTKNVIDAPMPILTCAHGLMYWQADAWRTKPLVELCVCNYKAKKTFLTIEKL